MNHILMRCGGTCFLFLALLLLAGPPLRAADDQGALFKSKCAVCHGASGKGDTPAAKAMGAPDFTSSAVQNKTDAQLIEVTTKGKGKMPGYEKSLSGEQIKGLVDYIRELGKKK
jgi:mono/diheme cytochrome c family protein